MTELEMARKIADAWLDGIMNSLVQMVPGDPDCCACVLARQFIRADERADRLRAALDRITKHPDCHRLIMQIALEGLGEGASPAPPLADQAAPRGEG